MPRYEVTWQSTGTVQVDAVDDLDAKTQVEAMTSTQRVQGPGSAPVTQVIATKVIL